MPPHREDAAALTQEAKDHGEPMRVIFVLTYPTYHAVPDVTDWLRWENRDRWMPGVVAAQGCDVELWAVAREAREETSHLAGFGSYRIRLFPASGGGKASRDHYSDALIDAARSAEADLFVLIGVDGGVGVRLFRRYLKPTGRRFAVVIGGDYYSALLPHADIVFYESEPQRRALLDPGWRRWRRAVPAERLIRLPKSIDTDRFQPQQAEKSWDVIAVSRLVRWKSFDEVGALSNHLRVAVVGDGPQAAVLKRRYPRIDWLGYVPNREVPTLLARARLYFHAGRREYFPRAIVEAMACGLPVVAFDDKFGPDVVPDDCGLLVDDKTYAEAIRALLADPDRLAQFGRNGRAHALSHYGKRSTMAAAQQMLARAPTRAGGDAAAPAWSVVIPYYNEAAFLPKTLASLIAQEYRPFRLILVDNASSDGSAAICREIMADHRGIETLHLHEPRPGKIHALERALTHVDTPFVALGDADTWYPPHYLRRCDALFARGPDDLVAVMAMDVYGDPAGWRARLRRATYMLIARLLSKQTHTGGYGQSFRTAALKRVGGFSERLWPYVLLDHEIMQRLFKIGRARYAFDLWCMPSPRRADRRSVRWNLLERLLYHATAYRLKDWYFYRFLAPRLARRKLGHLSLREKSWQ
jgi:glycosyltransferase involved in cell wall biosynthesis